jgi:phage repressor protein C with HTH and peptisase S24 domain
MPYDLMLGGEHASPPIPAQGRPRLIAIEGNGMEPTLRRGDFVVATPCDRFRSDGLYVVEIDGEAVVYRCQYDGAGNVVLWFDNPRFSERWSMPRAEFDRKVVGIVAAEIRVIDSRVFEDCYQN